MVNFLSQFKTLVFDSATNMELLARYREQFELNVGAADPRQFWGGSTSQLEQVLFTRQASLPLNVLTLAHIDSQSDMVHGKTLFNPNMPGRLRTSISGNYGEFYKMLVKEEEEETHYGIMTQSDNHYHAFSAIRAPRRGPAHYETLWKNWPIGFARRDIHALVYGPPGSGKTTFASTFPTPIFWFLFDSRDKVTLLSFDPRLAVVEESETKHGRVEDYRDKDGGLLFHVEHFQEENPTKPKAWSRFLARFQEVLAPIASPTPAP
jgi:hypothetical protein